MRAQTEKTTFTCKDNFLLTKRTRRWTYSALLYFFSEISDSDLPGCLKLVEDGATPATISTVVVTTKLVKGGDMRFKNRTMGYIIQLLNKIC